MRRAASAWGALLGVTDDLDDPLAWHAAHQMIGQRARQAGVALQVDGLPPSLAEPDGPATCTAHGATEHVVEYRGSTIRSLDMEERMTICNMSIEGGARAGYVNPDQTTFAYLKGRPYSPSGAAWDEAVARWKGFASDPGCHYDDVVNIEGGEYSSVAPSGALAFAASMAMRNKLSRSARAVIPSPISHLLRMRNASAGIKRWM